MPGYRGASLGCDAALLRHSVPVERIEFYRTGERFGGFSNFSRHPVRVQGVLWPTSEALFQAAKFPDDPAYRERIRTASSPSAAAALGRSRSVPLRSDWDDLRLDVMRWVLRLKFEQHPDLRELLLATGDALLVEHTPRDSFWGDGGDGSGENWLGRLLVELRSELRSAPPAPAPSAPGAPLGPGPE